MTFLSQILYNLSQSPKAHVVKEGAEEVKLVKIDDFTEALSNAEEAIGQIIIQNNADTKRVQDILDEEDLDDLDGAATLPQTITKVNSILAVLTQIVQRTKE